MKMGKGIYDATAILVTFVVCVLQPQNGNAVRLASKLSDPTKQPIFVEIAPNALDDALKAKLATDDTYYIEMGANCDHYTGLLYNGTKVSTPIFGYGQNGKYTWPGPTIEVTSTLGGGPKNIYVNWINNLRYKHILPVDKSLHWAFSLNGYENYTIDNYGIPVVPHLHGATADFEFDGHSEAFWTPDGEVVGPFWDSTQMGFTNKFKYDNDMKAAPLWYHDHTVGITRLNVYAGLAAFYFVRDDLDTGKDNNPLGLPAGKYELAYAIQDRMFMEDGRLFYPSSPGDPTYAEYIEGEGAELDDEEFPTGGPTALAEFFGDHIVVNGKLWPKVNVEPREYRLRLLNGCDSRFFVIQFVIVDLDEIDPERGVPVEFTVVGADNGMGTPRHFTTPLVFETAARYDIVIDFSVAAGKRVILHNLGGDGPFGGPFGHELGTSDVFANRRTDRIMAFDVVERVGVRHRGFDAKVLPTWGGLQPQPRRIELRRNLALFEGKDSYGRLQPVLGKATHDYQDPRGLFAAYAWFQETTEKPQYMTVEDWYLINFTEDAHSMHMHLVNFEVISDFTFRYKIDGHQIVKQHHGGNATAPKISWISKYTLVERNKSHYYDDAFKDVVTVLPGDAENNIGRGTIIRMKFTKMGLYAWHCHILSHEDHEMMRPYEVVPNKLYNVTSRVRHVEKHDGMH